MQEFLFSDFFTRSSDVLPEDHDLFKALTRLPKLTAAGPWLAGGALRRALMRAPLTSDYDFFFASQEQYDAFCGSVKAQGGWQTRANAHNMTFRLPSVGPEPVGENEFSAYLPEIEVQAIKTQWFSSLEAVLDSFDFTICQFGFDGAKLMCGDYSLWDLGRKRLVPHRLTFGTASMRRMLKYTNQGFTICAGGLTDILSQVAEHPEIIQAETLYLD